MWIMNMSECGNIFHVKKMLFKFTNILGLRFSFEISVDVRTSLAAFKHFTTQWRNSSIYKKNWWILSLTILSLQSSSSFSVSDCLSPSVLNTLWWSIITTLCVSIDIHHSLWSFAVRGAEERNGREKKDSLAVRGREKATQNSISKWPPR